jgi:hypothetical protein
MAAGLGFKDFTTGEVLTAADVDGYLMQGVWVFASATARDAAVTSPQEGNFAYLKDTNVTTYYTGSAWANLDTTGMTNPMTTTGDTIYSSSGSTPARLGIGTAGQVLQVNSGATAPEWATPAAGGGMTLLETLTLTGNSVTSSTLSSAYKQWVIYLQGVVSDAFPNINMRLNEDTGNNYSFQHSEIMTTLATAVSSNSTNLIRIGRNTTESGATYKYNGIITIMRPSDTDSVFIEARGNYYVSGQIQTLTTAIYDNSAAITKFTLFNTADNFSPNTGRAYIYGVN